MPAGDETDGTGPGGRDPGACAGAGMGAGCRAAVPGAGFGDVAQALGAARAAAEYLNSPAAQELEARAFARLAISFVSAPQALASALRRSLLGAPLNGKSVPLDIGYSHTIPDSIRRAVILRDQRCAWPGGCTRRPAACDVHHIKHKSIELLPDGSTRATSPDGMTVLRSHAPPPPRQPSG